jgi:hypothetical protein
MYYDVAFSKVGASFRNMKINYIGEVTRTEIFLQDITGAENLHAP